MQKTFWTESINFKNLKVPRFMSAPIDGFLDSPMRQLIRIYSPNELLFGQMRHVASVANAKITDEFNIQKIEHPICFQISANSTNFVEAAIEKILEQDFEMINLNSGCPARKIIDAGSGAALMANIPLLKELIKILVTKVNGKIPVTIKIRAGYNEKNGLDVAKISEDLGVDGIIIHPRLKSQGFTGELDFDIVRKIKQAIKIPVIFSGNIIDAQTVIKTYELTGVDGFMIGRAFYGEPWKIKQILCTLTNEPFEVSENEKLDIAIKHLKLNSKYYGLHHGFNAVKKHLPFYVREIHDAAKIRNSLVLAQSEQEIENILNNLKK